MIGGEDGVMTVREELHQAIESLPEEQIGDVLDYVEDLRAGGLRPETVEAIREGLEDIREGRVTTLEEYRRSRGL